MKFLQLNNVKFADSTPVNAAAILKICTPNSVTGLSRKSPIIPADMRQTTGSDINTRAIKML
jgi:hypothetical protein